MKDCLFSLYKSNEFLPQKLQSAPLMWCEVCKIPNWGTGFVEFGQAVKLEPQITQELVDIGSSSLRIFWWSQQTDQRHCVCADSVFSIIEIRKNMLLSWNFIAGEVNVCRVFFLILSTFVLLRSTCRPQECKSCTKSEESDESGISLFFFFAWWYTSHLPPRPSSHTHSNILRFLLVLLHHFLIK